MTANFIASPLFSWHHGNILLGVFALGLVLWGVFFNKLPAPAHAVILAVYAVPIIFAGFLAAYGNTRRAEIPSCPCCINVVIVLGAGLRDGQPGGHLARRLDAAAEFLHNNPYVSVVVTGGLGAGQQITEAEAMAAYLVRLGIAPERIILEDESTSTYENLKFATEITRDLRGYSNHSYVIVSNDFHIFRATRQARNMEIYASGLAAPTPWHSLAQNYLREMAAIVHYWLFSGTGGLLAIK